MVASTWRIKGRLIGLCISGPIVSLCEAVYLQSKFDKEFETRPIDFGVYFEGNDNGKRRKVVLDPLVNTP